MKTLRTKSVMLFALCACLASASWADEHTKETHMSIDVPVQVSGMLLAPGQYVFRLTDPDFDRSTVSIFNATTNKLEGTVIGLPAYRNAGDDKHIFAVASPQGDQPAKLQTWFYPGDNFGLEFPRPTKEINASNAKKSTPQAPPDASSAGDGSSSH